LFRCIYSLKSLRFFRNIGLLVAKSNSILTWITNLKDKQLDDDKYLLLHVFN